MRRPKILAMDFDGTLFSATPRPGYISPWTRKALAALGAPAGATGEGDVVSVPAGGITRVVVTGRNLRSLFKAFDSCVAEVDELPHHHDLSGDGDVAAGDYSNAAPPRCALGPNARLFTPLRSRRVRTVSVWRCDNMTKEEGGDAAADSTRKCGQRAGNVHHALESGSHFRPMHGQDFSGASEGREKQPPPQHKACVGSASVTEVEHWNRQRVEWLPADYVISGSGSCVVDWRSLALIETRALSAVVARRIAMLLVAEGLSFFLLEGPPASHHCHVHIGADGGRTGDFPLRAELYRDCTTNFDIERTFTSDPARTYSQFVLIQAPSWDGGRLLQQLAEDPNVRIVTMTSPGDGVSRWIEILPCHVSKSDAIIALAAHLLAKQQQTTNANKSNSSPFSADVQQPAAENGLDKTVEIVAVGNDTNDLDLLLMAARRTSSDGAAASAASSASTTAITTVPYTKSSVSPSGQGTKIHRAESHADADVVIHPLGACVVGDATDSLKLHEHSARFEPMRRGCGDGAVAEVVEWAYGVSVFDTSQPVQ